MLKINNISFSYDNKQIFKDFSLDINDGDRICLFGESGCGKTTLIRLIANLEKPQKGEITNNKTISYCFQENRLLPFKSVLENITLYGADENKAIEILTNLGLEDAENYNISELSGGMERRVALARALAQNFDVLLLDEPFTGLDENNITVASNVINEYLGNKTLILVTHSKDEAEKLGCKLVELNSFD